MILTIACYVFSGITRLFLMPGPRQLTCSGDGKCILIVSMPILGEKVDPLRLNLKVFLISYIFIKLTRRLVYVCFAHTMSIHFPASEHVNCLGPCIKNSMVTPLNT